MKNKHAIVTLAFLLSAAQAHAQQVSAQSQSSLSNKSATPSQPSKQSLSLKYELDIAAALQILIAYKVIGADQNQCLKFDGDVISELRKHGLIAPGESHILTVCVGASGAQFTVPDGLDNKNFTGK